jgi:superfamily II DNA helicase RecQ
MAQRMADIQLKHFLIPVEGGADAEEALNRFLRGHQILSVREEFVAAGADSRWCVAVRYAQQQDRAQADQQLRSARSGIDYKDELEPEAFARFVQMRSRRLKIANAEGMPAFAIFTDAELAAIAALENPTLDDLKQLKGVAKKKVARFAARILVDEDDETNPEDAKDEASGKTA